MDFSGFLGGRKRWDAINSTYIWWKNILDSNFRDPKCRFVVWLARQHWLLDCRSPQPATICTTMSCALVHSIRRRPSTHLQNVHGPIRSGLASSDGLVMAAAPGLVNTMQEWYLHRRKQETSVQRLAIGIDSTFILMVGSVYCVSQKEHRHGHCWTKMKADAEMRHVFLPCCTI